MQYRRPVLVGGALMGHGRTASAHQAPAADAGTLFQRCSAVFGEAHLLPARPRLAEYHDVLLWRAVLYDDRRQLLTDSAFFRGVPHMHVVHAVPDTDRVPARADERLPTGRYFWIGPFHLHFGHFTVSTLSRLWAVAELDRRNFTFLYVGAGPPDELFKLDFVRDTFAALGITPTQLRRVEGPLMIPSIMVAEPSLVENYGASPAYVAMLQRIRDALHPGLAGNPAEDRPVYVSKERVAHGVRGIANEDEVTTVLTREGVEVAYPETLPFREQVAFWCRYGAYAGFAGSAFHMAGFGGGKDLCTVSHDHLASCNQALIDQLAGNRHLYLHAGPELVSLGRSGRFTEVMSIVNPGRFARDMLGVLNRIGTIPGQAMAPEPRSIYPEAVVYEPFGTELARFGRASQSSDYEIDEGRPRTADGALSGVLTGAYQCSTRCEDQPWWQVELPVLSRIHEVRIFNRCDQPVVQMRLVGFRLSVSRDGLAWSVVHVHDGAPPGPKPYRWQAHATTDTRFVRISLPGRDWLHLDQVEVFGEELQRR